MTRRLLLTTIVTVSLLGAGVAGHAQIEGGDRGVPPIDSTSSFEVGDIRVDVAAKTADAARFGGWRLAQRRGWKALWAKTHGGSQNAPAIGDATLDSIVSGIVVDEEYIGPQRYVARLGVLFDRARASEYLGVRGEARRSPPLLVIPVLWSGGTPISFEQRSEWQKAWARFRASASPIDYVRPTGVGPDPLLLTYGQTERPGRTWWRMILDQYGAADVIVPQVRLIRSYPGGPIRAEFVARYGPDNKKLGAFALTAATSEGLPALMDEGVRRVDAMYARALADGILRTDTTLIIEKPVEEEAEEDEASDTDTAPDVPAGDGDAAPVTPAPDAATQGFTIQFDTPDVSAVTATEDAVRGVAGVSGVSTTSLALGGVSVMRVTFTGDAAALRQALAGAGLRVDDGGGGTIRIRR